MARLPRFDEHRYIGTRDDMRFYDCDDAVQFQRLEQRYGTDDLMRSKLIQTFGPDEASEARNRGFRPVA